jgi:hypothetical protein
MNNLDNLKNQTGKFLNIGKDGDHLRLGWVNIFSWEIIQNKLNIFFSLVENNQNFIFIGMGGSINIIKALISFYQAKNIYTIDSLDPQAYAELQDIDNPLIIVISKSGTTLETRLIAEKFSQNKTIWLKDQEGDLNIQFDDGHDIGGRFSAPNTLIFWLPLFLIFQQNLDKTKEVYDGFISQVDSIQTMMWQLGQQISESNSSYFQIFCQPSLTNWMTQLFQESLGSKIPDFHPKTIIGGEKNNDFYQINLSDELITSLYQAQILVAAIAYFKNINFVNQPSVEKYKKLINADISIKDVNSEIILPNFKFVEIICYWYLKEEEKTQIKAKYQQKYPNKTILVFEGSDWNHHSFQAAVDNPETLFYLLSKNVNPVLQKIALATYKTLEGKSVYQAI